MWSAASAHARARARAPGGRPSLRTTARARRGEESEAKEFVLGVNYDQDQVLYRPADAEEALGAVTSGAAWADALFSFVDSIDGELPRLTPTLSCRRFLRSGTCAKLRGAFQVDACVKCYEVSCFSFPLHFDKSLCESFSPFDPLPLTSQVDAPHEFVQAGCAQKHVMKWCRDFQKSVAEEEEEIEERRAEWRSAWANQTEKRAEKRAEKPAAAGGGAAADTAALAVSAARERRGAILDSVTALFDEAEEDEDREALAFASETGGTHEDDVAASTHSPDTAMLDAMSLDERANILAAPRVRRVRTAQAPATWLRSVVVRGVRGDFRWLNALYVRESVVVNGAPLFVHESRPNDAVLFVSKRGKLEEDGSERMWSIAPRAEVEAAAPAVLLANALNASVTPVGQMWQINPIHRRGSFDVNELITVSGHAWRAYGGAPWEEWIAAAAATASSANASYGILYHNHLLHTALEAELPPSFQSVVKGAVGAEGKAYYGPATHHLRRHLFGEYTTMLRQVGELCLYYVRETGVDGRPIRREGSKECSTSSARHSSDGETATCSAAEEYEQSRANAVIGVVGHSLLDIYAVMRRVGGIDDAEEVPTTVRMRELVQREGILSKEARSMVRSVCNGDMLLGDGDDDEKAASTAMRNEAARSTQRALRRGRRQAAQRAGGSSRSTSYDGSSRSTSYDAPRSEASTGLIISSPSTLRAAMEQGGAARAQFLARVEGRARVVAELRSALKAGRATWKSYGRKTFMRLRRKARKVHLILSEMRAQMEGAVLALRATWSVFDTAGGGMGEEGGEGARGGGEKENETEAEVETLLPMDATRTMRTAAIDVVNASDLSFERFMREYAMRMRPVIIRGLSLTKTPWNLEHIRRMCGKQTVDVVARHSDERLSNNVWGGLAPADRVPLNVC